MSFKYYDEHADKFFNDTVHVNMNEFYEDCQNGEMDDLDWLTSDNQMDDFIGNSELEYVRIYDYALLELSRRLLKMINDE